MKRLAALTATIFLLSLATPVFAHRLDEYLQATTFEIDQQHIIVQMRLTPGVEVCSQVLSAIDTNGDGVVSEAEQRAYAASVIRDVSLRVDGNPVTLRLLSSTFPAVPEMQGGLGDIVLRLDAAVAPGGFNRKLIFDNHHQSSLSVYLVNCLVPRDNDIHVIAQDRSYDQSHYELDYTQTGAASPTSATPSTPHGWFGRTGSASLFKAFFYQGVHHILTGYDHLLFVSALVLAATTLWDLVKVVSTFTIAHTITLTLAALNLVHVSAHVVEPFISASIVFIAMQNVFWPTRARGWSRLGAAFFFGLFHGLGFAGGLLEAMQQMQSGTMLLAIFAFSIGVEAGHQMVVVPLYAALKAVRGVQPNATARARFSMSFQRIGSAAISLAGCYYLCVALSGNF